MEVFKLFFVKNLCMFSSSMGWSHSDVVVLTAVPVGSEAIIAAGYSNLFTEHLLIAFTWTFVAIINMCSFYIELPHVLRFWPKMKDCRRLPEIV